MSRAVIVTGASRGIGREIALRFGADGSELALIQRGDAAETVRALGRPAVVEQCDLANAEAAERATVRAIERLGRVDVCVCNAGAAVRGAALEVSVADFRRIVELNLVSTFAVARAAARAMKDGGSIVMTASVISFQGGWRVSSYAASKAGVANLVQALSNEWASLGIRVNAVAPGYIENEFTAALRADPYARRRSARGFQPAAGDTMRTSPKPSCGSRRPRLVTSMDIRSWSTGDGWAGNPADVGSLERPKVWSKPSSRSSNSPNRTRRRRSSSTKKHCTDPAR